MKPTILVVEDSEPVRQMMARALLRGGYDVLAADSGAAALKLLDVHGDRISAIVTDVHLQGDMTGTELALRMGERWSRIPILYTSGDDLRGRLQHFLPKPFEMQHLLTRVSELIEGAA